jgi:hypothetical protein
MKKFNFKKNIIIFSVFIINGFIYCSCVDYNTSNIYKDYIENDFRNQEYNLIITNKYTENRHYRIVGINKNDLIDTTEKEAIDRDLYELAKIGDTLLKDSGKVEMYLKQKDTIIEFPCYCDGKRIE